MKILFEYTANKIKNIDVLKKALHIIENESMQGFFKSKGESEFKKYSDKSPLEDAKKIEIHILKVYGKGSYKLTGNLAYNSSTKQVKFYILSAFEEQSFKYDDKSLVEFFNEKNGTYKDEIKELENALTILKKTKPAFKPSIIRNNKPNSKSKPNPKRKALTDNEKLKRERKENKKNFRTDARRKISNNRKQSF